MKNEKMKNEKMKNEKAKHEEQEEKKYFGGHTSFRFKVDKFGSILSFDRNLKRHGKCFLYIPIKIKELKS